MVPTRFHALMWNSLHTGRYHQPHLRSGPSHEWMILRRFGPDGTLLELSDAGAAPPQPLTAPARMLVAAHSLLALLTDTYETGAAFIFVRALPADVTLTARFFPADGHVTLCGGTGPDGLRLTARGRHCHHRNTRGATTLLEDVPHPGAQDHGGLAWSFDAVSVGELRIDP